MKNIFIKTLLVIILYRILLDYIYTYYISMTFSYSGYTCDFNLFNYTISWIVIFIIYVFIYNKRNIYISEIFMILYVIYLIPLSSYYALSNKDTLDFIVLSLPLLVVAFFITNKSIINIYKFKKGKLFILLTSIILIFITILHYLYISKGNIVLSLNDVYIFRGEYGKINSTGIFGYLNSWVPKVFTILIFLIAIKNKSKLLIFLSVLLFLLLFISSGHKSVFTGLFLVPLVVYVINSKSFFLLNFTKYFIYLLMSIQIVALFYNIDLIESIIYRRAFFVPPHLSFVYLEFFSSNPFAYWGNSFLKGFVNYPYDTNIANVIGIYLGHPMENANNGFMSSGFAQAGYLGVFIYTFILVIIFNIINQLAKNIDKTITISIIIIPIIMVFTTSDLFTTILTHGLLVSIVVLYLYSERTNYKIKGIKKYVKI